MEHHKWVSNNAPPHGEVRLCYEMGFMSASHTNIGSAMTGILIQAVTIAIRHSTAEVSRYPGDKNKSIKVYIL